MTGVTDRNADQTTTNASNVLNDSLHTVSRMELSPALTEALGYMHRPYACPDDVKTRIVALHAPAEEVSGGGGPRITSNWRSGPPSRDARAAFGGGGSNGGHSRGSDSNRGRGGGSGSGSGHNPRNFRNGSSSSSSSNAATGSNATTIGRTLPPPRRHIQDAPRFGNRARKDVSTEERMMDRIRDKMNKFSEMTYDTTKTWLCQLLDSGESDFLTDFIALVFEKAAAEPPFCPLYARLIADLRAGFPHINTDIHNIFDHFMSIFAEAAEEPDMGTAAYDAFVALRERAKFRRGYAAFIAEVTKRGVLTVADVVRTCNVVLDELVAAKVVEGKQHLCEEYADCLKMLMLGCESALKPSAAPLLQRIKAAMDRTESPSMSNNARFSLMDVMDAF
jgi:hypothetical protein